MKPEQTAEQAATEKKTLEIAKLVQAEVDKGEFDEDDFGSVYDGG